MNDSDSSTLSDESTLRYEEPVLYGGGLALVDDGIGFPESINYFAHRTLQADQDPAALIPVYLMRGQAGDLIGDVGRLLLRDYHNLKYELKVIAFHKGITGRFYVQFKTWSEKLPDGTRACRHNFSRHQTLEEITVEGIYLAKRSDIDEPSPDQHEQVLDDDSEPDDDYPDPYDDEPDPDPDDEPDPDDGWFEDDGRHDHELLSFYQDEIRVVLLIMRLNNPIRRQLGWVFRHTSTTLESLESQISFCAARARLPGEYRKIFKDGDGDDCFVPEEGNDGEWHAFVEMLSEIELHATRIDGD
ncbi:hypothetical protein GBA52_019120 [Prunus armeniaca]|nr:hypothetical protein GBA52_019120 [Prunus armeniaca]